MATKTQTTTSSAGDMSEFEAALDQGFIGIKVDPLPNEAYTVAGVASGKAADQDRAASVPVAPPATAG